MDELNELVKNPTYQKMVELKIALESEEKSREIALAITKLQECMMWWGNSKWQKS